MVIYLIKQSLYYPDTKGLKIQTITPNVAMK